jgi:hypothetical protein
MYVLYPLAFRLWSFAAFKIIVDAYRRLICCSQIFRELIGINPTGPCASMKTGGKKKKKSAVAPKIVAILRGIMEFESDWGADSC